MSSSLAELTFERDVRPILKAACFHCHGEDDVREGNLDLRLVRLMRTGGESGPAVTTGEPERSLLWKRIASDEMPEGKKKLSADEKETIHEWLKQGAKTARPEPDDVEEARFTQEELDHWAFQSMGDPSIPIARGGRNPIDAFVRKRVYDAGLTTSAEADRRTLIRRVTFDLTGLPPTSHEVDAFVSDPSPNAYERLVDRLLGSPQFGVRWGRHWLDVAGYAETHGSPKRDTVREGAWRYRDYVIDSFNANKPIDLFLTEQLAGDELFSGPLDVNDPRQLELLSATGFLRMAPDGTQEEDTLETRNNAVADAMQVVSTGMLGLTVGCAQCHDHKYDPIGSDDYYRFRAIFDPAFPLEKWQKPQARLIDMTSADIQEAWDKIEREAKALEDDLNARRNARGADIQELKLADVPEADREATRLAVKTPNNERTERQKALLDMYPMVKPIGNIVGLLVEYDGPAYRAFQKEADEIAKLRDTKPILRKIMATTEPPGPVPVSHVFFRGNPESKKKAVEPGELTALQQSQSNVVSLPINDPSLPTTGRRLAYAQWLTNGEHPTVSRVFANRLWLHHFGRGLVASPNDFGIAGDRPSHPELLDWLARELVRRSWDQKQMHRLLVLSQTYRQVSHRRPEQEAIDPENALFARANLRRREAEGVRDALLSVTENLSHQLGGPSLPVTESKEGKAVLGVQKIRDGLRAGADGSKADGARRSAYVEVRRRLPLNVLATFDQPVMRPNCAVRRDTTVAMQALWFLNDEDSLAHATKLAELVMKNTDDPNQRLAELSSRLFGELPTDEERATYQSYLDEQMPLFTEDAEHRSWASLCQVLLASNRFLYID